MPDDQNPPDVNPPGEGEKKLAGHLPPAPPTAPPSVPTPPAAAAVLGGSVTEETATLRKQLEETARKLKERETRINELEDVRTREGATRKLSKKDRWTFFDSDDE
jgi:hypothetical protein